MTAVVFRELRKSFARGQRIALDGISGELPEGKITGIVGPDGAGKTTLLRILAGLMGVDGGLCTVWGYDIEKDSDEIQQSLGYLPQRFGLYEELTVAQNLTLYADLQGVSRDDPIFHRLMEFSGLGPFQKRLSRNLSGGMKQKLGLMATLLRRPKLLILDEPTMGVDPMSAKELWRMVFELNDQGMTIVLSTSYLQESDNCDIVVALSEGRMLYSGTPQTFTQTVRGKTYYFMGVGDIKRKVLDEILGKNGIIDAVVEGENIRVLFNIDSPKEDPQEYGLSPSAALLLRDPTFEDAYINKLGGVPVRPALKFTQVERREGVAVEAKNLKKVFGEFTAVDDVSFTLRKGEIFGLLGPNGAGKSTTFKMLCGLLRPTEGEALVGGLSLRYAPGKARALLGYMAQKFSLYDNMTVEQNLLFFSGVYSVENRSKRIEEMVAVFDLDEYRELLASELPLGFKQRLALCCALMHQPQVLFLDEPTSGVDPLTRREFWHQINLLASSGVSILVSTHLMDEAEFCDRIGFIYQGRLKVIDTPDRLKGKVPRDVAEKPTLVDAFTYFCSEEGDE